MVDISKTNFNNVSADSTQSRKPQELSSKNNFNNSIFASLYNGNHSVIANLEPEYNEFGQIVSETGYTSDTLSDVPYIKVSYEYNDKGQVAKATVDVAERTIAAGADSPDGKPEEIHTMEYDNEDNLISKQVDYFYNGELLMQSEHTYQYDKEKGVVTEYEDQGFPDGWGLDGKPDEIYEHKIK